MVIASFLIWIYEVSHNSKTYKETTRLERDWGLYDREAWMPCVKEIHSAWLLAFRIITFCLLFTACTADVVIVGIDLFHYYTQWTSTLVIFYLFVCLLLPQVLVSVNHPTLSVVIAYSQIHIKKNLPLYASIFLKFISSVGTLTYSSLQMSSSLLRFGSLLSAYG